MFDKTIFVKYRTKQIKATESRYAPIQREALAITYACEHCHQYMFGQKTALRHT